MATVTIQGSRNLVYVDLNVSESSYDIGSNTSNVSYSVVIRKGSKSWNTSWTGWNKSIYVSYSIHGHNYTTYIPTYNYNGNVPPGSTIASGTINNVPHNSDGTLSIGFGISLTDTANGNNDGSYYTPGNASWSESSLALTNIPRQANLTSAPDFNDEQNPTIGYSNPAGNSVSSLQACISLTGANSDISYRDINKTGSSYTFSLTESERNVLRNACTTGNSRTVVFYVKTVIGSNTFYSTVTKTLSIVNANPTFTSSNVSYRDTNSSTVNVTENNQHLVQALSNLLVSITSAVAKKGASITRYEATINGQTKNRTSAGDIDFGVINSGSNLTLSVKVIDSRGNTTTATKTVQFLAWSLPTGIISLKRKNNYENESYLKVQSTYSSVNSKNSITIKYQYKKTSDQSYSSETTINNNTQITLILDKNYAWDFRIKIIDRFGTTTYNTTIAKGKFVFFVDTKKLSVGINCFPSRNESLEVNGEKIGAVDFNKIYPVGSIYMSVNNTNPSTLFGGTWQQLKDRFLLGAGNSYSAGGTGGASSVTLNTNQIPSHNHSGSTASSGSHNHGYESQKKRWADSAISGHGSILAGTGAQNNYECLYYTYTNGDHTHSVSIGNTGGGQSHENMPPYLAVYMWKRTN